MFKVRCAKKVHSDDVLHGKTTCWVHFARKRRRIQACCKEKWQVERRFSEEKASFGRSLPLFPSISPRTRGNGGRGARTIWTVSAQCTGNARPCPRSLLFSVIWREKGEGRGENGRPDFNWCSLCKNIPWLAISFHDTPSIRTIFL